MRIIYFDMDCTRPDHLGVYGYHRETSPVLDELAQSSVVFDNCFASDTPCLPSRAALFSCRPGIANGVISHEPPGCTFRFPAQQWNYYPQYTMPMRVLQQHGYHTVTFTIFAQRHSAWWFNAGFSEVSNPTRPCSSERAETINPRAMKWLRDNLHDHPNLFVHLNCWDSHTPYKPDDDCRARVARHRLPEWPDRATIRDHHHNVYGPKTARDIMIRNRDYRSPSPYMPDEIADRDDFRTMMDSYDGCIATVDRAIAEIIALLKEEGVYEETAIIVSGDHGEAIGQLGMYFEHGFAIDGVARGPLIVRWPGLTDAGTQSAGGRHNDARARCSALVYQYDWMATVMDLLGIERPTLWDAQPLTDALHGRPFDGRPYLVYGCGIFSLQRAVRTRQHAYIRTLHPGCYPLDDSYLFDVITDPDQAHDIKDQQPHIAAQMEKLYADWWHTWCAGPNAVVDPMHAQITDFAYFPPEQMFRRLEHLGRQDQIQDLEQRLCTVRRQSPGPYPNSRY